MEKEKHTHRTRTASNNRKDWVWWGKGERIHIVKNIAETKGRERLRNKDSDNNGPGQDHREQTSSESGPRDQGREKFEKKRNSNVDL